MSGNQVKRLAGGSLLLLLLQFGCSSEAAKRLDHFKGTWQGTFSLVPAVMVVGPRITQPDSNTIFFTFSFYLEPDYAASFHGNLFSGMRNGSNSPECTFRLRYDETGRRYLLDVTIGPKLSIVNLPLSYSETQGYSGTGGTTIDGRAATVTAKIEDHITDSQWTISLEAPASTSARQPAFKDQFVLMLQKKISED